MSLLKDYLLSSQGSLKLHLKSVKGNKNRIEVLRRLIEKAEKQHNIAEERSAAFVEAISNDIEMKNGGEFDMGSARELVVSGSTENHKVTGKRGGLPR